MLRTSAGEPRLEIERSWQIRERAVKPELIAAIRARLGLARE